MTKTFTASLASLGLILGGCALAHLQPSAAPAPSAGPAAKALAQALLGEGSLAIQAHAPTAPERITASYRALTDKLQGE